MSFFEEFAQNFTPLQLFGAEDNDFLKTKAFLGLLGASAFGGGSPFAGLGSGSAGSGIGQLLQQASPSATFPAGGSAGLDPQLQKLMEEALRIQEEERRQVAQRQQGNSAR